MKTIKITELRVVLLIMVFSCIASSVFGVIPNKINRAYVAWRVFDYKDRVDLFEKMRQTFRQAAIKGNKGTEYYAVSKVDKYGIASIINSGLPDSWIAMRNEHGFFVDSKIQLAAETFCSFINKTTGPLLYEVAYHQFIKVFINLISTPEIIAQEIPLFEKELYEKLHEEEQQRLYDEKRIMEEKVDAEEKAQIRTEYAVVDDSANDADDEADPRDDGVGQARTGSCLFM